jgi:2-polyprenyl-3-methyl-5-hydroxy-6-metoxy-1,4-benzoquinol methylase
MDDNYLDRFEEGYDTSNQYWTDNKLSMNWYPKRIIEISGASGQESVLDLGLGHGKTAEYFGNFFKNYEVIEGSSIFIEKHKKNHPKSKIIFKNCFFENFDEKKEWDLIIMGYILEHVDDPGLILKKFRNYLNTNGSVFIVVPNAESLHRRFGYEAGILKDYFILSESDMGFGHKRLFSLDQLTNLVKSCNYKINRVEGIFLKPITTQQIKMLKLSSKILNAMLTVGINYPELCNSILMEIKKT